MRVGVPAAFMEENEFGKWLNLNKSMEHWQLAKDGKVDVFLNLASEADGKSREADENAPDTSGY